MSKSTDLMETISKNDHNSVEIFKIDKEDYEKSAFHKIECPKAIRGGPSSPMVLEVDSRKNSFEKESEGLLYQTIIQQKIEDFVKYIQNERKICSVRCNDSWNHEASVRFFSLLKHKIDTILHELALESSLSRESQMWNSPSHHQTHQQLNNYYKIQQCKESMDYHNHPNYKVCQGCTRLLNSKHHALQNFVQSQCVNQNIQKNSPPNYNKLCYYSPDSLSSPEMTSISFQDKEYPQPLASEQKHYKRELIKHIQKFQAEKEEQIYRSQQKKKKIDKLSIENVVTTSSDEGNHSMIESSSTKSPKIEDSPKIPLNTQKSPKIESSDSLPQVEEFSSNSSPKSSNIVSIELIQVQNNKEAAKPEYKKRNVPKSLVKLLVRKYKEIGNSLELNRLSSSMKDLSECKANPKRSDFKSSLESFIRKAKLDSMTAKFGYDTIEEACNSMKNGNFEGRISKENRERYLQVYNYYKGKFAKILKKQKKQMENESI